MNSLDQIKAGMVLSRDIIDQKGRTLFQKGTQLTSKHIKNLKAWGIQEVSVIDHQQPKKLFETLFDPKTIDSKVLAETKSEVNDLFRHSNIGFPPVNAMYRLTTIKKLKEKSNSGGPDDNESK